MRGNLTGKSIQAIVAAAVLFASGARLGAAAFRPLGVRTRRQLARAQGKTQARPPGRIPRPGRRIGLSKLRGYRLPVKMAHATSTSRPKPLLPATRRIPSKPAPKASWCSMCLSGSAAR